MTDQMKATSSSLYSSFGCPTPNLDRLSSRGVRFDAAITPHPLCVPARVSMWRSQYPHTHGARRNETLMPGDGRHAVRLWKDAGYECGLIGKNHCFEAASDLDDFDVWCEISHAGLPKGSETRGMPWVRPFRAIDAAHAARRSMVWHNPKVTSAITDLPAEDHSTGLIAAQVERYLETRGEQPFALWVSFPDPHEPYETPRQYADLIDPDALELPPFDSARFERTAPERNRVLYRMLGVGEREDDDLRAAVRVYLANVRFIDDAVGRIVAKLEDLGLEEDTIVVFCSDHGDFAGERRMMVKGGVFYDCLTRVPLIVSWPGTVESGEVVRAPVSLIDIVPTLLHLQGLDTPEWMQGRPLPGVTGAEPAAAVFSEYGAGGPRFTLEDLAGAPEPYGYRTVIQSLRWREAAGRRTMVRTAQWKYVHDPMGDIDELYDLEADPWELENLAGSDRHTGVEHRMLTMLADFALATQDPHPVPLPEAKLRLG